LLHNNSEHKANDNNKQKPFKITFIIVFSLKMRYLAAFQGGTSGEWSLFTLVDLLGIMTTFTP